MPTYCASYSLSDNKYMDFQILCDDHVHDQICTNCENAIDVLDNILEVAQESLHVTGQEKIVALFEIKLAKAAIQEFMKHVIRMRQQDLSRSQGLENLQGNQVYIVTDWAMKWILQRGREDSTNWFGKRGIPWSITVAYRRNATSNEYSTRSYVHVFDSCKQDSLAVTAIIEDTLHRIKAECPEITEARLQSDNAAPYKSAQCIASVPEISRRTRIKIARWDFTEVLVL